MGHLSLDLLALVPRRAEGEKGGEKSVGFRVDLELFQNYPCWSKKQKTSLKTSAMVTRHLLS